MKTKYNQGRRSLLATGGFFLALSLSQFPHLYAQNGGADSPAVESNEGKNIRRNDQPMEPDNSRGLVGPSGQEIHDFLYPPAEDRKDVTPAT